MFQPPAELSGVVRFCWTLSSLPNEGTHFIFRTMASESHNLFVFLRGDLRSAPIGGPTGQPLKSGLMTAGAFTGRFMLSGEFSVMGYSLYPFAPKVLFNLEPAKPKQSVVPIKSLENVEGEEFSHALAQLLPGHGKAGTDESRMTEAILNLVQMRTPVDIDAMASECCVSRRTLERHFKEYTGLSPRAFSNIMRFQSSIDELSTRRTSLTEVAYNSGYYDQSHFTNDFTRYSDFSPKHFTTPDPEGDPLWLDFVAFFQFLSWCPPVCCGHEKKL